MLFFSQSFEHMWDGRGGVTSCMCLFHGISLVATFFFSVILAIKYEIVCTYLVDRGS